MSQPIWRAVVHRLAVPDRGKPWTLAMEFVTPGKVMMVRVATDPPPAVLVDPAAQAADPAAQLENPREAQAGDRAPELPPFGTWKPEKFVTECSPDGDFDGASRGDNYPLGALPVPSAAPGALVARIGGSPADLTIEPTAAMPRLAFAIGRTCVFTVPSTVSGSLYLGINDDPTRIGKVTGELVVDVFEAL